MVSANSPPVTPAPSATVMLIRQNHATIQVYLLRRSHESSAFPGFYVFPGGTLEADDQDANFWMKHVDLAGNPLRQALGGQVERRLPFIVAAVRETFEEAGLLMASSARGWFHAESLSRNEILFSRQIADHDLRLSVSKLACWCRWISPESMPKRFDTFFFAAPADPTQDCRPDNHETVDGIWIDPATALIKNSEGSFPLSPPTLVTLHQLLGFNKLDDLMAEARGRCWPEPLMPRMCPIEKGALIIEPWDPDYAARTVVVDVDRLENDMLPPHVPFSRLWLHHGHWRPVARPDAAGENMKAMRAKQR